jgi:hypothetical protein
MSDEEQSGAGRREVAYRLFAAEFDDADYAYSESDEERAPNYVITPTGARVNRLFVVGVLTEVEQVSEDVLRGRVVDPTGAFVLYAGQYQPDEQAFLDRVEPPTFVALTGKARTFQPDDSDQVYTSVRPESLNEVDAETRDRWTLQAAEQTVDRVRTMAGALALPDRGEALTAVLEHNGVDEGLANGIPLALAHYETEPAYLRALYDRAVQAGELVAGERDEVEGLTTRPDAGADADLSPLSAPAFDRPESVSTAEAGAADPESGAEAAAPDSAEETPSADSSEPESRAGSARASESTGDGDGSPAGETTVDSGDEDAPTTDGQPASAGEPASAADSEAASGADTGSETAAREPAGEETSGDEGDDAPATAESAGEPGASDDIGDFDGEFELDEDEREEVEAEYGTEFQTGTEVDEPGEADIDAPDPDAAPADEAAPAGGADEDGGSAEAAPEDGEAATAAAESAPDADESSAEAATGDGADEQDGAVDLEDLVVEIMEALDDGSGADRSAVVSDAVDRSGADEDAVRDAIQDALMDGRCYEPDDDTLQPI